MSGVNSSSASYLDKYEERVLERETGKFCQGRMYFAILTDNKILRNICARDEECFVQHILCMVLHSFFLICQNSPNSWNYEINNKILSSYISVGIVCNHLILTQVGSKKCLQVQSLHVLYQHIHNYHRP